MLSDFRTVRDSVVLGGALIVVLTLHSIWGIKQVVYNLGNARGRPYLWTHRFLRHPQSLLRKSPRRLPRVPARRLSARTARLKLATPSPRRRPLPRNRQGWLRTRTRRASFQPPEIVKRNVSLVWAISQWNVVSGKDSPKRKRRTRRARQRTSAATRTLLFS